MNRQRLWERYAVLSPEEQRHVLQFIGALVQRKPKRSSNAKMRALWDEPFVGMWQDRDDLADSRKWVKLLRRREWNGDRA